MADAKKLKAIAEKSDALFVLTHNYTGYPLIREARQLVENGDLGDIRLVQVEYAQDWLTEPAENDGIKQAEWRTDPARSGAGGSIGDIGTHAYNLASFVSGLKLESVAADMQSFVTGRLLDDNAHVMMRYDNGARGMLWCSQVAPGNENALRLRVYGTKAGLEWEQENPNVLNFTLLGEPKRVLTRAGAGTSEGSQNVTRTPPGHPEGYLEAFANIYGEAADAIEAHKAGTAYRGLYPSVQDGLDGMKFIDACVKSSSKNAAWVKIS